MKAPSKDKKELVKMVIFTSFLRLNEVMGVPGGLHQDSTVFQAL